MYVLKKYNFITVLERLTVWNVHIFLQISARRIEIHVCNYSVSSTVFISFRPLDLSDVCFIYLLPLLITVFQKVPTIIIANHTQYEPFAIC